MWHEWWVINLLMVVIHFVSPWYDLHGWLGVKKDEVSVHLCLKGRFKRQTGSWSDHIHFLFHILSTYPHSWRPVLSTTLAMSMGTSALAMTPWFVTPMRAPTNGVCLKVSQHIKCSTGKGSLFISGTKSNNNKTKKAVKQSMELHSITNPGEVKIIKNLVLYISNVQNISMDVNVTSAADTNVALFLDSILWVKWIQSCKVIGCTYVHHQIKLQTASHQCLVCPYIQGEPELLSPWMYVHEPPNQNGNYISVLCTI